MDHSEASRLKAAEKYISGELPSDLRDQFEEHYFDCAECAKDLKALATFVTAGRIVFEEEAAAKVALRQQQTERIGWFSWLRPIIAVPAIAALAAVVVFQSAVTIPELKHRIATGPAAQVYESSFRLQGTTRGESISTVTVHRKESFALDFDFTPSRIFHSYKGNLVDPSGQIVLTFTISGEQANKELHLAVPAATVQPEKYHLLFTGENGAISSDPKANEVQRLSFAVEFRP
jgi:hypothetical protein